MDSCPRESAADADPLRAGEVDFDGRAAAARAIRPCGGSDRHPRCSGSRGRTRSPARRACERASVSVEDLPDYEVGWIDVLARETAEAYIPPQTPNGRTISRRALAVNDVSEALLTIARSRVALPTVSSFASASAHPDIAYIPITDMPVSETALVWRRLHRDPRLREFVRLARGELARG